MTCGFALPRPLRSSRFTKVENIASAWWAHWLRVTDPNQLDEQFQAWLCESYRLVGMQGRLADRNQASRRRAKA